MCDQPRNPADVPKDRPRPSVFVLMPFSKEFDEVYLEGIKPACTNAGVICERVDEQLFQSSILERVYDQIRTADFVVAVMTGRNANVFYEVGYAHALGKQVILLTASTEDIPFDLTHYPHIVYKDDVLLLRAELSQRLSGYLSNPWLLRGTARETPSEYFVHVTPEPGDDLVLACQCHTYDGRRCRPLNPPLLLRRQSEETWVIDSSQIRDVLPRPSDSFKFYCEVPISKRRTYMGKLCEGGYIVTGFGSPVPGRPDRWRIWFLHGEGALHPDVVDIPRLNHRF